MEDAECGRRCWRSAVLEEKLLPGISLGKAADGRMVDGEGSTGELGESTVRSDGGDSGS